MSETTGQCYCGKVQVVLRDRPLVAGFCHCRSCRTWHAAPINAWAGWPAAAVSITGETTVSTHSAASARTSCAACGGIVANGKPAHGMTVIYPNTLNGFAFVPIMHIFYEERVIDMADGLPKFMDMPEKMGGSGRRAEEPDRTRCL